jgi:hypothetical protein
MGPTSQCGLTIRLLFRIRFLATAAARPVAIRLFQILRLSSQEYAADIINNMRRLRRSHVCMSHHNSAHPFARLPVDCAHNIAPFLTAATGTCVQLHFGKPVAHKPVAHCILASLESTCDMSLNTTCVESTIKMIHDRGQCQLHNLYVAPVHTKAIYHVICRCTKILTAVCSMRLRSSTFRRRAEEVFDSGRMIWGCFGRFFTTLRVSKPGVHIEWVT